MKVVFFVFAIITLVSSTTIQATNLADKYPPILDFYPNCSYEVIKHYAAKEQIDDPLDKDEVTSDLLMKIRKQAASVGADAVILVAKDIKKAITATKIKRAIFTLAYEAEFIHLCSENNQESKRRTAYNHQGDKVIQTTSNKIKLNTYAYTVSFSNVIHRPHITNQEVSLENGVYGVKLGENYQNVITTLGTPNVILNVYTSELIIGYGRRHWLHFQNDKLVKIQTVPTLLNQSMLNKIPFLDFFDDGHLYVIERPVYSQDQLDSIGFALREAKVDVEALEVTLSNQLWESKRAEQDQLIGKYNDGVSDLIVIKEGTWSNAYIVETSHENVVVGELKARFQEMNRTLRGVFYTYTHTPLFMKGGLYKDGMLLRVESSIWIKTGSDQQRELNAVNFEDTNFPTIQKIDDDNVLFTIPRFSVDNKVWRALVKEKRQLLLGAKNLIFDIRGNRGGNAIYLQLFNLFSDQEMPGGQGHVLASEDNLKYFERNMQYSKKIYEPVVMAIKENMGEVVDGPLYPKRNYRRDKRSKIEHVAILTDHACMSAAESFIIHAKQVSTLVQTFGSPTDGVIDYTSIGSVVLRASGSQKIIFGYPTSTLHKDIPENGYNRTGIIPDVPIQKEVKDKVAFIMDYYKK